MLISITTLVAFPVNCMQNVKLTPSDVQEMSLSISDRLSIKQKKHAKDEINRLKLVEVYSNGLKKV